MHRAIQGLVLFVAVLMLVSAAAGEINSVTVTVDGLACPFCAYGFEKKLKKVEGVGFLDIKMTTGTVTISAEKGRSIDLGEVPRATKESGFSLREIRVEATGIVRKEGLALLLKYGGPGQEFYLKGMNSTLKRTLLEYADKKEPVAVKGLAEEQPDGPWTLRPESLGSVSR